MSSTRPRSCPAGRRGGRTRRRERARSLRRRASSPRSGSRGRCPRTARSPGGKARCGRPRPRERDPSERSRRIASVLPLHDNVPTRRTPVVTIGLIAANFVVWIWELQHRESTVDHYAYYPCSVQGPCLGPAATHHLPAWEGAFTSMFMHASWLHILGNMLFLWIFGNNVEDALGRVRFLLWYVVAGIAATALQTFVTLHYGSVTAASVPNIGASGAIAGVLGAYFILLPRARVLTWIVIVLREIPAFWFLGIW